MKPKIYLAGWTGEVEYRNYVHRKYGKKLNIFDPMIEVEKKISDFVIEKSTSKEKFSDEDITKIVEGDKAAITTCDIVTVIMNRYTAGTCMEILYAWENKIPVYLIDPSGKFKNDIWISYHTTFVFDKVNDCYDHIIDAMMG